MGGTVVPLILLKRGIKTVINSIKEVILKILSNSHFSLYAIREKKEYGLNILEVLIEGKNLNSDILESLNKRILKSINDLIPDDYYLEVSSAGIERKLESLEEIIKEKGSYIYLRSKEYNGYGYILDVSNDTLVIKINLKGRFKEIKVLYSSVYEIRKAVKI